MKKNLSFLPLLLIIFGLGESIFSSATVQWLISYTRFTHANPYGAQVSTSDIILFPSFFAITLAQVVYGIYLQLKQNRKRVLSKEEKMISKVMLISGIVVTIGILAYGIVAIVNIH